ncbi:hypothetical protein [Acidipila sp. EB88]|uniref:hypothetical protein n=1 Tax=Acidipila sp. EB88 TaxID=2305226 RepID=UPI000F5F540E|nr:hypothetical protein [Acidipila sp. EB88]
MSNALAALGAFVLRQGAVSEHCAEIDFEFPRVHAMDVYCLLVANGIELSQEAHQQLADLCHCTQELGGEAEGTLVRINVSVYARAEGESFLGAPAGKLSEAA